MPFRRDSPAPTADAGRAVSSWQAFLRVFPGVMVAMFLAAADQTIGAMIARTIPRLEWSKAPQTHT
jgi:hypothetical protein